MSEQSLQDGIDEAGSPIRLIWKFNPPRIEVPAIVPREYTGWDKEQVAWLDGVVLFDQCHHMNDTFIEGPDALRLIEHVIANSTKRFEVGQAKHAIFATPRGNLLGEAILLRSAENKFILTGQTPSEQWTRYQAERGGYDVQISVDPDSAHRSGPPRMLRYQIQGPKAMEVMERLLGGPPPAVKFFFSEEVTIAGRKVRAFRHGMSGMPGFELQGDWEDNEAVKNAILEAGAPSGMVQVGAWAYYTNAAESGWIALPTPAIYTDPELEDYRRWLPLNSYEGRGALHGSFFSENIEDYYVHPEEYGYGHIVKFDRDYIGRDALQKSQGTSRRTKVTFEFNKDDVRNLLGENPAYLNRLVRDRVEIDGKLVGLSINEVYYPHRGTILSLGLVDKEHATPGTQVNIALGDHPGPDAPAGADRDIPRLRATVAPSPYIDFARSEYRS